MKKEPLTRANVDSYIEVLRRLSPDDRPIFGSLDARGMLRHLRHTFDSSIGEPETEDSSKPVVRWILWILAFRLFTTWPGGKIKGPDYVTPTPEHEFEEERERLFAVMNRFVEKLEIVPDERHINPGLGPISLRKWSVVHGLHTHHHFRQFDLF